MPRSSLELRDRTLRTAELEATERGALLALLGTAERVFVQIDRIIAERDSVDRDEPRPAAEPAPVERVPDVAAVPDPAQ